MKEKNLGPIIRITTRKFITPTNETDENSEREIRTQSLQNVTT